MKCIQPKYMFSKTSKKQILMVPLQNYTKIRFKRLFNKVFLKFFSNRPYSNVKITLTYFHIIETI